jgi:hypothetical protein
LLRNALNWKIGLDWCHKTKNSQLSFQILKIKMYLWMVCMCFSNRLGQSLERTNNWIYPTKEKWLQIIDAMRLNKKLLNWCKMIFCSYRNFAIKGKLKISKRNARLFWKNLSVILTRKLTNIKSLYSQKFRKKYLFSYFKNCKEHLKVNLK